MKIGIIIHSHTGNTLLVANKLMEAFLEKGNSVTLERVEALNEEPSMNKSIQLVKPPEIGEYDIIIFGAPVKAFSLSPIMMEYLKQIKTMEGKKVGYFVTEFFPCGWMGGKNAMSQMKKICDSKKAIIFDGGIINWSNNRNKKIDELIQKLIKI